MTKQKGGLRKLSQQTSIQLDDEEGEDFVDIIAEREWREVVEKC